MLTNELENTKCIYNWIALLLVTSLAAAEWSSSLNNCDNHNLSFGESLWCPLPLMGILLLLKHSKSCKCWISPHFRTKPLYAYHSDPQVKYFCTLYYGKCCNKWRFELSKVRKDIRHHLKNHYCDKSLLFFTSRHTPKISVWFILSMYTFHQAIIHLFISQLKVNPLLQLIISREKRSHFSIFQQLPERWAQIFSTSPTLELSNSDSIISKQSHYPNCSHWINGDPQYADCIPRNLNCFPRIFVHFSSF